MEIKPFAVEQWMNAHETAARWNVAETCVDSLRLSDLLALCRCGDDRLAALFDQRLTYGHIPGSQGLREAIAALYGDAVSPDCVLTATGAIGANLLVHLALVEPGDTVVCVRPTYQQLFSVSHALGARVRMLRLRCENRYLPDPDELRSLTNGRTRLIVLNNPNNPTGSLMDRQLLGEIVEVARSCGAYVHCDEVYRGLEHEPGTTPPSIVDLYEKGVSTGSMSKAYALAGLRLGWVAASPDVIRRCLAWRDYTTISCGVLDDALATLAITSDAVLERSRRIVRRNAALLEDWVAHEPHLWHVPPCAGTTTLVHYDYPLESEALCATLFDFNGALVVPGAAFGEDSSFRVGFACAAEVLDGGLAAISQYLRTLEA